MSDENDTESEASFKSARDGHSPSSLPNPRFPPEEEATLVTASNELKTTANIFFSQASYSTAIQTYDKAIASCPNYLEYEIAVLRANIAACHLKLGEWKEAVEATSRSLDGLESIDPVPKEISKEDESQLNGANTSQHVEEVDDETVEKIDALQTSGHTRNEVQKIRIKALMRRAKARSEIGGWAALQGADEDYKQLLNMRELMPLDRKIVEKELKGLPTKLQDAKEKEMGEMMGKLKELGNGILKPFGLSTDNFNFVKDESSGGYSMQFNQNTNSK